MFRKSKEKKHFIILIALAIIGSFIFSEYIYSGQRGYDFYCGTFGGKLRCDKSKGCDGEGTPVQTGCDKLQCYDSKNHEADWTSCKINPH